MNKYLRLLKDSGITNNNLVSVPIFFSIVMHLCIKMHAVQMFENLR